MRLLFASLPMDGHFNPLTGLAVHLQRRGHDVRWYTGESYAQKLARLGVPHLPFLHAKEINGENLTEHYPEYEKLGLGPKAIAFALEKVFFVNLEAHLHDLLQHHLSFPFEAVVFDGAFYAGRLIAEKLGVPAFPIWPAPTPAPVSKSAPPPFFGLRPMKGPFGWLRDALVMKMLQSSSKGGMKLWHALREREALPRWDGNLFDVHNDTSRTLFMVGAPGMDFPREDWPRNLCFVGALLPHPSDRVTALSTDLEKKLAAHAGRVVVVAQGTIDNRDPEKLIVPTLSALAETPYLVVATTGGRHTEALRKRFTAPNVVIEDWLDYGALMQKASLFVSNGGYGSVMHALVHGVPLLLAGKLEGKNDINARLDYRKAAIDLRTERPTAKQIRQNVERVMTTPTFRSCAERIQRELQGYDPFAIIERHLLQGVTA